MKPASASPLTKYSPTHCTSTKTHHGLHRVAVGATGRSPAHPHGAPTHIPGSLSPRASFHSPLHCMLYTNKIRRGLHQKNTPRFTPLAPILHVVNQRNTQELNQQNTPRVTSRSCRGEWKLARHTCNADTQYIPVTHYMHKGCTGFPAQPMWLRVLIVILIDYNLLCRVVHDHNVESANKVIRSTVFAGVDYRAILAYDCHLCAWA